MSGAEAALLLVSGCLALPTPPKPSALAPWRADARIGRRLRASHGSRTASLVKLFAEGLDADQPALAHEPKLGALSSAMGEMGMPCTTVRHPSLILAGLEAVLAVAVQFRAQAGALANDPAVPLQGPAAQAGVGAGGGWGGEKQNYEPVESRTDLDSRSVDLAAGWRSPTLPIPVLKQGRRRRCSSVVCQASGRGDDDDFAPGRSDDAYLEELEAQLLRAASRRSGKGRSAFKSRRRASAPAPNRGALPNRWNVRGDLVGAINEYATSPGRELLLGSLFMLVGFYFAHFIDCVFGQSGYWETFAGFGTLLLTENITREYYRTPSNQRSPLLKLTNSFKVGLYYGFFLDAIKMAG